MKEMTESIEYKLKHWIDVKLQNNVWRTNKIIVDNQMKLSTNFFHLYQMFSSPIVKNVKYNIMAYM